MKQVSIKFMPVFIVGLMLILTVGCKEDEATAPSVTTMGVSDIRLNSVLCKGHITSDGGSAVTARGFVWSSNISDPTLADNVTVDGAGDGRFSTLLSELEDDEDYFVKAYATNKIGTTYGKVLVFKTAAVTDADGNAYRIVTIGTQTWMVDNLKTTKYRDGSDIPLVTDDEAWKALTSPGYCWTENNEAKYKDPYGALYNWYTVNTNNLCPDGWHVPSDAEWTVLIDKYKGSNKAGGKLKEAGTEHWISPNTGATNESGFTGLPGSFRQNIGKFTTFGYYGSYWSSKATSDTYANSLLLQFNNEMARFETITKKSGMYVRCIQDSIQSQQ
jgi:uncharacterized protein (TIGR02145 family)